MDDYWKIAFEIVKAQATTKPMTANEIMDMAKELAAGMKALAGAPEAAQAEPEVAAPVMNPKKSIREKAVTCLECGKVMKLITAKHLASHGLTKAEYLAKYGMKKGTSLLAKGLSRTRKEKMNEMQLWKRRGAAQGEASAAEPKKPAAKKAAAPKKPAAKKGKKAAVADDSK